MRQGRHRACVRFGLGSSRCHHGRGSDESGPRQPCGECHPGISTKLAATPIHGIGGEGLRTEAADIVEKVYIVAIIIIIGLMVLHWILDIKLILVSMH